MPELNQYLRISLAHVSYLLPSEASISIEQRDNLVPADKALAANEAVTAWRVVQQDRWPAFHLGGDLQPSKSGQWQRAIFLEGQPHPLGLIADEIQLLPRADVRIEPFTPLGHAPSPAGPLFSGAWMHDNELILVFEPKALVGYLGKLWKA